MWNDFIKQLKSKNVITTYEFSKMRESKCQIINDRKHVKEVKNNATRVHCRSIKQHGRETHEEVEEVEIVAQKNVIGHMQENRRISIESVFPLEEDPSNLEYYDELLTKI